MLSVPGISCVFTHENALFEAYGYRTLSHRVKEEETSRQTWNDGNLGQYRRLLGVRHTAMQDPSRVRLCGKNRIDIPHHSHEFRPLRCCVPSLQAILSFTAICHHNDNWCASHETPPTQYLSFSTVGGRLRFTATHANVRKSQRGSPSPTKAARPRDWWREPYESTSVQMFRHDATSGVLLVHFEVSEISEHHAATCLFSTFVLGYLVPLVLIVFFNSRLIRKLYRHTK